jgi:nucleotide-binding universal stress UspA family protein
MIRDTILVPLDGSTQSEAVLPYATAIARVKGATLRLLSVVEAEHANPLLLHPEQDSDLGRRLQSEAAHYLGQMVATLKTRGIEASSAVVGGIPAEEILRMGETGDIAIIAMSTHGRGGFQRWALGSVADKVMRMSEVPTLLVRPPETPPEARRIELHQLLVPLDGSPLAEAAIAPAVSLAQAAGSKLVLLRVEPWLSTQMAYAAEGGYMPDLTEWEEEVGAAAKEYVDAACRRVPAGIPCESVVLRGFASIMLEAYAEQNPIDLVVMSTHGRGGFARFVVGSTADSLVRSGLPALLIRPEMIPEVQTHLGRVPVAAAVLHSLTAPVRGVV